LPTQPEAAWNVWVASVVLHAQIQIVSERIAEGVGRDGLDIRSYVACDTLWVGRIIYNGNDGEDEGHAYARTSHAFNRYFFVAAPSQLSKKGSARLLENIVSGIGSS
jgi:hypothetical protein